MATWCQGCYYFNEITACVQMLTSENKYSQLNNGHGSLQPVTSPPKMFQLTHSLIEKKCSSAMQTQATGFREHQIIKQCFS